MVLPVFEDISIPSAIPVPQALDIVAVRTVSQEILGAKEKLEL